MKPRGHKPSAASLAVVAVEAQRWKFMRAKQTVPRPGTIQIRKAYSFARRGISVIYLVVFKVRESGRYFPQSR
jgi:hypothetical protein